MTVLLDDNFARGAAPPPRERKSRLTGGLLLVFLFLSAALMVLSRLDHELVRKTRTSVTELLVPMVNHASTPANGFHRVRGQLTSYFDLFVELERLKQENQRLRQWESRAMHLEYQVAEYRQLLNGVKDFNRGFVTGRMIADGRGPFMRSALVNIGRDNGVTSGSAVVDRDGFVGRIVDVGEKAARVLFLTDLNSRIPVLVGKNGVRSILVGNNSDRPELNFLPSGNTPKVGDAVYTSGHGGLLPAGLRVGIVEQSGTSIRVQPHTQPGKAHFVSVLKFDTLNLGQARFDTKVRRPRARRDIVRAWQTSPARSAVEEARRGE